MKKILIVDFLCAEAHRNINENLIECFSRSVETTVLSINKYYHEIKNEWEKLGIHVIETNINIHNSGKIGTRVFSLKSMSISRQIIKKGDYDLVVVLGFETIAYSINVNFSLGKPTVVFHHRNIDELSRKQIYKKSFEHYKNKIFHFVFEKYFRDYLIHDIGIKQDHVYVIPHPVNNREPFSAGHFSYDCVGLSNSNSEEFISEIINSKDKFKNNKVKILLKSKKTEYADENVIIIKGHLDYNTYNNYILSAKTILVPVLNSYKYRLSGSIYDGLVNKKIVFTTSTFYSTDYGKRYPGICIYVDNIDDLISKISSASYDNNIDSFNLFIMQHSKEETTKRINDAINKVLEI
jgi:hypothetical protein